MLDLMPGPSNLDEGWNLCAEDTGLASLMFASLDDSNASARLRNLPRLADARLWVLVLFPTDRHHVVASFACGHDDAEFVRRCRKVVIRLVSQ